MTGRGDAPGGVSHSAGTPPASTGAIAASGGGGKRRALLVAMARNRSAGASQSTNGLRRRRASLRKYPGTLSIGLLLSPLGVGRRPSTAPPPSPWPGTGRGGDTRSNGVPRLVGDGRDDPR